jgi:hypothetical protein
VQVYLIFLLALQIAEEMMMLAAHRFEEAVKAAIECLGMLSPRLVFNLYGPRVVPTLGVES